jgi:hypothetical protein
MAAAAELSTPPLMATAIVDEAGNFDASRADTIESAALVTVASRFIEQV